MRASFGLVAGLTLATPAFGAVSYLTQSRSVSVYADGNPSQSQNFASPDFLPFNATAQVNTAYGSPVATQSSSLDPGGFTLSASCRGNGLNAYNVGGSSHFDITFSLDQETQYSLSGALGASGGPGSVVLSGQLTGLYYQASSGPIANFGVFPPGTYRLQSDLSASNYPGFDPPSSIDLTFTLVPSPGPLGVAALGGLVWGVRRRR